MTQDKIKALLLKYRIVEIGTYFSNAPLLILENGDRITFDVNDFGSGTYEVVFSKLTGK